MAPGDSAARQGSCQHSGQCDGGVGQCAGRILYENHRVGADGQSCRLRQGWQRDVHVPHGGVRAFDARAGPRFQGEPVHIRVSGACFRWAVGQYTIVQRAHGTPQLGAGCTLLEPDHRSSQVNRRCRRRVREREHARVVAQQCDRERVVVVRRGCCGAGTMDLGCQVSNLA